MSSEDFEAFSVDRLEREIGELAAHINAATCRWLLMVAELDRREAWKAWGCRSCAEWLSLRCGLAANAGREHVRVARRLGELPLVREEFACGRLSYSKARALTRVASEESEAELVALALEATAAQLERIVRAYRGAVSADPEQANQAFEDRELTCTWDDDGSLVVRGRLPAETGALFLKSLAHAGDNLREQTRDVSAETPEPVEAPLEANAAQRRADALGWVAERSLGAFPGCTCHRHVDGHHIEHWARGGETKLSRPISAVVSPRTGGDHNTIRAVHATRGIGPKTAAAGSGRRAVRPRHGR